MELRVLVTTKGSPFGVRRTLLTDGLRRTVLLHGVVSFEHLHVTALDGYGHALLVWIGLNDVACIRGVRLPFRPGRVVDAARRKVRTTFDPPFHCCYYTSEYNADHPPPSPPLASTVQNKIVLFVYVIRAAMEGLTAAVNEDGGFATDSSSSTGGVSGAGNASGDATREGADFVHNPIYGSREVTKLPSFATTGALS